MTKKGIPFLKKKKTTHHILPRSRGGSDEDGNTQMVPDKKHTNWHICFGNDVPEEVVAKMLLAWDALNPFEGKREPFPIDINRISKRRKAWKSLFQDATQQECVEIVIKDFGKGREALIREVINGCCKNRA